LRCLLITTLTATIASVTAAPSVSQNSMPLLSQQTLQKHFHNNNNNNNMNTFHNSSSDSSSSDISTFTSASAHNYNHRHSQQLSTATFTPLTPAPPTPVRMMDIVILNGSTSSSGNDGILDGANTNTLKSLSSIREAAMAGVPMGDVNQLPIFDFGLPRNITARTGQAEAAIKCRVERLDDKSVSWIRKRDLHILTVATATYTSDKRFQ
ncbi:uncharacterized protein DDB_G0281497-like, partial [Rhagoletis pomonella]|uniref:uncharacterized protein DDB_G0281497-like n=1 Tax=Rhagoletis pomonella TaxID=28610 RepID=UPI00178615A5